jgi:hypothetical protein
VTPEKRLTGDAMGDPSGSDGPSNIAMAYTSRKSRYATPMGDSLSDLIKCGQSAVGAAIGGATDPYLPEVICRVAQLQALGKDRSPLQAMFGKKPTVTVPACAVTPAGKGGIGLERAVRPLRALVYVNRHPTTAWLGLAALLGVPMLVGYMIGRRR